MRLIINLGHNPIVNHAITLASLLLMASPAFAGDWLVFRNGDTRTNEYWSGNSAPVAGQSVPAGSVVKSWSISNGDKTATNYRLSSGSLIYDPPPPPAPPDYSHMPNPDGFIQAIWDDPNLVQVSTQLVVFKPLLKEYIIEPPRLQQAWQRISANMPAPAKQAIEAYATAYNVPLVAEEGFVNPNPVRMMSIENLPTEPVKGKMLVRDLKKLGLITFSVATYIPRWGLAFAQVGGDMCGAVQQKTDNWIEKQADDLFPLR